MRCFKRPNHDWNWNLVNTVWPIRLVSCSLLRFQWFGMRAQYVRCQKVFVGLKNWMAVPFRSYANFRGHTEVFTVCKGKGMQPMGWFSQLVCVLCFQANQAEEVKGANLRCHDWKSGPEWTRYKSRWTRYCHWTVILFLSSPWPVVYEAHAIPSDPRWIHLS